MSRMSIRELGGCGWGRDALLDIDGGKSNCGRRWWAVLVVAGGVVEEGLGVYYLRRACGVGKSRGLKVSESEGLKVLKSKVAEKELSQRLLLFSTTFRPSTFRL